MINNTINLLGRITQDIEVKGDEKKYCRFSVAVDRDKKEKTVDFINCTAFSKTAEFLGKYFHKGDPILLSGNLSVSNYTDKDGIKRTSTQVNVEQVSFVPSVKEKKGAPAKKPVKKAPSPQQDFDEIVDSDDDDDDFIF